MPFQVSSKEKSNLGSQISPDDSRSNKRSKTAYDWKKELFHDFSEIQKAQKLADQYEVEEAACDVTTKPVQRKFRRIKKPKNLLLKASQVMQKERKHLLTNQKKNKMILRQSQIRV